MDMIKAVFEYMVGVQLHPMVTAVVLIVIAIGRQRWEECEPDPVKARKMGQRVLLVALVISILGQLSLYWPANSHDAAICVFMALGQVGVASFGYTYAEKWGIMDRIGRIVQKKMDDKGGSNAQTPPAV